MPRTGIPKSTKGWSIGIAQSQNLVHGEKVGELKNTAAMEQNGFCVPGAIVLGTKVHLFYQTYGIPSFFQDDDGEDCLFVRPVGLLVVSC